MRKTEVFMKTATFGRKTAVFDENHTVRAKNCSFWADLSSETGKTTFPTQPSRGQHQTLKSMDFSVKQRSLA